jgi:hypothetical protein
MLFFAVINQNGDKKYYRFFFWAMKRVTRKFIPIYPVHMQLAS